MSDARSSYRCTRPRKLRFTTILPQFWATSTKANKTRWQKYLAFQNRLLWFLVLLQKKSFRLFLYTGTTTHYRQSPTADTVSFRHQSTSARVIKNAFSWTVFSLRGFLIVFSQLFVIFFFHFVIQHIRN